MAKWTDYTTDTNPTDTDEVMTLDADKSPKANKRVTLSTLADYFLDKLASKVFAKLETQNHTVIGALNELNSKALPGKLKTLSNGESYSFSISHNSLLIYSPTDDLGTICVLNARGYNLIVGRIESVNIKSKGYSVTITNNMGWPVTFVVI